MKTRIETYEPRKRAKRALRAKKPRVTDISLWREWNVPDGAYHRYKGLRGIYWYWLSRDVRKTDWDRYGVCVTCLQPVEDWRNADCGHMIPSDRCGEYLRFFRRNLSLQHKKCNNPRFTPHAGVLNAIHMDTRHGAGTMAFLEGLMKKECKEPRQEEYRNLIRGLSSYQKSNEIV